MMLNTMQRTLQFNSYSPLMDNLFIIINGVVINLDFINNFFRQIYYDINDLYALKQISNAEYTKLSTAEQAKYFSNRNTAVCFVNSEVGYNITRIIEQPHGRTTILLLSKKESNSNALQPGELALKIYKSFPVNINEI